MKYSLCSISFRHDLISFDELLQFAFDCGFNGIELWSVHAESLAQQHPIRLFRLVRKMRGLGLEITMLSGYIAMLMNSEQGAKVEKTWLRLVSLARLFKTNKIRVFAGNIASANASQLDWKLCIERLQALSETASKYGIYTVVETHPDTLADHVGSTLKLVHGVRHPFFKINIDFLHLWEAGDAIAESYDQLKPWIVNCHFKNVRRREEMNVFAPDNVYSPGGRRESMVSLAEGEVDYSAILRLLIYEQTRFSAAIEWFGVDPFHHVARELKWLKETEKQLNSTLGGKAKWIIENS